MADMEKLLDGLRCRATNFPEKDCAHCHYGIQMGRRWGCDFRRMTEDALALLKAQEAVKPTRYQAGRWFKTWCCGACGGTLLFRNGTDKPKYCTDCGQAVKWDG